MKQKLIELIREKEIQMQKLAPLIDKNPLCSELFNKVLIEKAILRRNYMKNYLILKIMTHSLNV